MTQSGCFYHAHFMEQEVEAPKGKATCPGLTDPGGGSRDLNTGYFPPNLCSSPQKSRSVVTDLAYLPAPLQAASLVFHCGASAPQACGAGRPPGVYYFLLHSQEILAPSA